jgi:hypothetical protein
VHPEQLRLEPERHELTPGTEHLDLIRAAVVLAAEDAELRTAQWRCLAAAHAPPGTWPSGAACGAGGPPREGTARSAGAAHSR